jgi:hypothetical protein
MLRFDGYCNRIQSAVSSHRSKVILSCNHAFMGLSLLFLSVQIVSLASFVPHNLRPICISAMSAHDI